MGPRPSTYARGVLSFVEGRERRRGGSAGAKPPGSGPLYGALREFCSRSERRIAVGAPQARPAERGSWGPASGGVGGPRGRSPPDLVGSGTSACCMEKILVSACLLGARVRYHGGDAACDHPILRTWANEGRLISVCPEQEGGLP